MPRPLAINVDEDCRSAPFRSATTSTAASAALPTRSRPKLKSLYGDTETYLSRFEQAARAAEKTGVILSRDIEGLIEEARETTIG